MVVVAALLNPNWRVEIEMDAVVSDPSESTIQNSGAELVSPNWPDKPATQN
jgi:hypothetical protein